MEQGQEAYQSWLKFFEKDLDMKKAIYEMMPDTRYSGESHAERVSDNLYYGIRDLKTELLSAAGPFLSEDEKAYIQTWARESQLKVAEAGLNINKLHQAYKDTIGDMRPDFVRDVNSNVLGYYRNAQKTCPLSRAKTFNEILHRIHAYMERNNYLHDQFPKTQNLSPDVTILGTQTPLAAQLEASLAPLCAMNNFDRRAGQTSIVSINENSALVMMRDIGHSTTFKIDRTENGQFSLSYYIPKVVNEDMVRQLPGLNAIQTTGARASAVATGGITTDQMHIGVATMMLAYNIPTDSFLPELMPGAPPIETRMPNGEVFMYEPQVTTSYPSFHTAEQIIAQELPTAYFEQFMAKNPEYACSDIGIDAIMRGYERDYPGYIMDCVENGYYVPESILQEINELGHVGPQQNHETENSEILTMNNELKQESNSFEWEFCE